MTEEEKRQLDICRIATIYESIVSIFSIQLSIEEMEKMIVWLKKYVEEYKKWKAK